MCGTETDNEDILQKLISYTQYESVQEVIEDIDNPGQTKRVSHTKPVQRTVSLDSFMTKFKADVADHVQHMFRYKWQAAEIGDKARMLQKPGHIAVAMDFAENHTILEPVEVQSMHWTKEQTAILVFVVYSLTPTNIDSSTAGSDNDYSEPNIIPTIVMEQFFFYQQSIKKGL